MHHLVDRHLARSEQIQVSTLMGLNVVFNMLGKLGAYKKFSLNMDVWGRGKYMLFCQDLPWKLCCSSTSLWPKRRKGMTTEILKADCKWANARSNTGLCQEPSRDKAVHHKHIISLQIHR